MENLDKFKIGEFINSRRECLKITQEDLGEKLGVTSKDVLEWEEGQKIPDINLLPGLANILGVSIDELLIQKNKGSFIHNKNNKFLKFMICLLVILNVFLLLIFIPKKEKLTIKNFNQYYYINPCASFEVCGNNYSFYGEIKNLKEISGYILVLDIIVEINYYDSNNSLCQLISIESREIILDEDNSFSVDFGFDAYPIMDFKQFSAAKVEYQVVEVREQIK